MTTGSAKEISILMVTLLNEMLFFNFSVKIDKVSFFPTD